jgi:D-glycero-D-manno-heptose 1,7-bisphosphate phosphatase
MSSEFWTALSSISTAIASLVVIIALLLSYREIREMARARSLDALLEVFKSLTSEDTSISRRYVLTHDLPLPGEAPPEVYEHMHKVWVSFDNLGLMVHFEMLPKRIALPMFYGQAIKCWNKLEQHIRYEEYIRKTWYQIYFKEFYDLSYQHSIKIARRKSSKSKIAQKRGKIGKARVLALEAQGIYETLGLKNNTENIQIRLNKLRQTVFLDRDGTLNVDDYVTHREEQFQLIEGVKEGLLLLKTWDFDLVVVSNQSGIGRGDYPEEDMVRFNDLLIKELEPIDIRREDFYFCPHDPEKEVCDCCKPNPGMMIKAAKDRSINLAQSYIIGDKMSDILAGHRAGCKKTILVKTGITDDLDRFDTAPDYVVDNLIEAAQIIARVEGIE